jgi:galactose-6-phosphate isomerase
MAPMLNPALSVLSNPMFLDDFQVFRRKETVDNSGIATVQATLVTKLKGVVHPDGDQGLKRKEDYQEQAKNLTVITSFSLRGAALSTSPITESWQADLVLWNNNTYLVDSLSDWSKYGVGFVRASCCLIDFQAAPIRMPVEVNFRRTLVYVPVTIVNSTTFTLPVIPVANGLMLFRNGTFVSPQDYSMNGNVGTLVQPLDLTTVPHDNLDAVIS